MAISEWQGLSFPGKSFSCYDEPPAASLFTGIFFSNFPRRKIHLHSASQSVIIIFDVSNIKRSSGQSVPQSGIVRGYGSCQVEFLRNNCKQEKYLLEMVANEMNITIPSRNSKL